MSRRTFCVALFFWVVILGAHLYLNNPIATGRLIDDDDYMRFVQVFQFLDGGGWYNFAVERMNPPEGTQLHWSRLPDLPLAAIVGALEGSLGRLQAAAVAATVVPALLMLAMLLAISWAVQPVIGRADGDDQPFVPLVLFAIMQSLNGLFAPGRVDHHNWQLLILAILTGGVIRASLNRTRSTRTMILCGLATATTMWVGGETLPWIGLFVAALSLLWVFRPGGESTANGLAYALSLLAGGIVVMPLALPPQSWLTVACDAYSIASFGLIGACALFWGGLALADRYLATAPRRFIAAALLAGLCLAGIVLAFPECLKGPYGALDPRLTFWLISIQETLSIFQIYAVSPASALHHLAFPATGLAIALWQWRASAGERRTLWAMLLLWGAVPVLLSSWEIRVMSSADVMALPALAWGYSAIARYADAKRSILARVLLKTLPILPLFLLDHLLVSTNLAPEVKLATNDASARGCDLRRIAGTLNDPNGLGSHPRLILNFINHGSELLYRTEHSVISAPYHRNEDGLLTALDIFSAHADADARALVDRRQIDLIIICRDMAEWNFYSDPKNPTFLDRLGAGQLPDWVKPVPLATPTGIKVFAVSR